MVSAVMDSAWIVCFMSQKILDHFFGGKDQVKLTESNLMPNTTPLVLLRNALSTSPPKGARGMLAVEQMCLYKLKNSTKPLEECEEAAAMSSRCLAT